MRPSRRTPLLLGLMTILFAGLLAVPSTAEARKGGPFGLGLEIGDPSGLSFKYFAGGDTAIDGALGFSVRNNWFHAHLDYLFHFPQNWGGQNFLPYVGIGAKIAAWDANRRDDWYDDDDRVSIGARVPLGLAWYPRSVPIDIFAEIVPALWVLPGTHVDFDFGLGARFYF